MLELRTSRRSVGTLWLQPCDLCALTSLVFSAGVVFAELRSGHALRFGPVTGDNGFDDFDLLTAGQPLVEHLLEVIARDTM